MVVRDDWSFDIHCTNTVGKMMARIPHIRAIRDYVSKKVPLRVSKSLVCSLGNLETEDRSSPQ